MTTHLAAENSVLSSTAPEPGQLVEVRRRQWIVSDVDASAVSPELPKRNLVKLASIDEDALGEEIEVLFPPPEVLASFDKQGREYLQARREVMTDAANPIGLTKLYNRFHDAEDVDARIVRLREMHREIDAAVMRAYGWDDLDLGDGYHEQPNLAENDRVRFTISDAARAEVLCRFAELNRQRYEEEQAAALAAKPRSAKSRAKAVPASQGALALVDAPEAEPKTSKTKAAAPAKKASTRSSR